MNLYAALSAATGTHEAAELSLRLSAWHDEMVVHERRIRTTPDEGLCDDDCPHAEAQVLWTEALETFGSRAYDLVFLRSRARDAVRRWRVTSRPPAASAGIEVHDG